MVLSPFHGDVVLAAPVCLRREELAAAEAPHVDLVLLSCKAYDLDDAMDAIAPAVGPSTTIVPMLNGLAHLDRLAARFGHQRVLGGYCMISASLDAQGRVCHHNAMHKLALGELDGRMSERVRAIAAAFSGARCELVASERIIDEMWEKWMLIASAAGITCLMRAPLGTVVRAGGAAFAGRMLDECLDIAEQSGRRPSSAAVERLRGILLDAESPVTASMCKDIAVGAAVEAEQIIGDLLRRRVQPLDDVYSLLELVAIHLDCYQRGRHESQTSLRQ